MSLTLMMLLAAAACFTTNMPEFQKDAGLACAAGFTRTVDVYGKYPGDVTLTMTYDFDLAAAGPVQIAGTRASADAYKAAVASNEGMRKRYSGVARYTLILRDAKTELCRFVFEPGHAGPKVAICVTGIGEK